jgi:hydroperoxide dehydratase
MTSKKANSGDAAAGGEQQKRSPSGLPIRDIPGGYGVPFFSPLRDRLDYFYFKGAEEYFRSRIARHDGATVLRVNMPPGPFISGDSRVVAVLDARSFRVLLDDSLVDKADTLDGTYVPSLALFGGHRPLAFLDVADPRHAALKRVMIRLAAARMHHVAPAFGAAFAATFDDVEAGLAASGSEEFNKHNMRHMLDFTCAALFGGALPSKAIGVAAAAKAFKWLVFQLHPIASKAIKPWLLEDLLFHTFRLPPFLVRRDYADLTAYFADVAAGVLDEAEMVEPGAIPRDELFHNLIFVTIFNAYGGYKIFLPHLVKWLARGGAELHARLADEVRAVVPAGSTGAVTLSAVEKMPAGEVGCLGSAAHGPAGGVPVRPRSARHGRREPRRCIRGEEGRDAIRLPAASDARRARVPARRRFLPRPVRRLFRRRAAAAAGARSLVKRA